MSWASSRRASARTGACRRTGRARRPSRAHPSPWRADDAVEGQERRLYELSHVCPPCRPWPQAWHLAVGPRLVSSVSRNEGAVLNRNDDNPFAGGRALDGSTAGDLPGRLAGEAAQRPRQVRLVGVAGPLDRVEDGRARSSNATARSARSICRRARWVRPVARRNRRCEVRGEGSSRPPRATSTTGSRASPSSRSSRRTNASASSKSGVPLPTAQQERGARHGEGQTTVDQAVGRKRRQEGAEREPDAEELRVRRRGHGRGLGLRAADGHGPPPFLPAEHELPVGRRHGEEGLRALAAHAPDAVDERGVRRRVFEVEEEGAAAPAARGSSAGTGGAVGASRRRRMARSRTCPGPC